MRSIASAPALLRVSLISVFLWAFLCASLWLPTSDAAAADKAEKPAAAPATGPASPPAAAPATEPKPGPADVYKGDADGSKEESAKGGSNTLPIPRFVSLRTNPVNLRTGPGVRYPVDWVYVRRRLPVEVIGEFDTWRRIRDPGGTEGWVHQSMLSGRRTAIITTVAAALRHDAGDNGAMIAKLESGVIVNVQRCPVDSDFCRVEVNGLQGWLKREDIWGVYPTETVQ